MAIVGQTIFNGLSGPGTITAPNVLAGDKIVNAVNISNGVDASALFGPNAPANGLILQEDTNDNSSFVFMALLDR